MYAECRYIRRHFINLHINNNVMDKKLYTYDILGKNDKKIGSISNDLCTYDEMIIKAQGILMGAGVLRSFIQVKVRESNDDNYCYAIKSY